MTSPIGSIVRALRAVGDVDAEALALGLHPAAFTRWLVPKPAAAAREGELIEPPLESSGVVVRPL